MCERKQFPNKAFRERKLNANFLLQHIYFEFPGVVATQFLVLQIVATLYSLATLIEPELHCNHAIKDGSQQDSIVSQTI